MQMRLTVDPIRAQSMTGDELRASFLVEDLFARGELRLLQWEAERTVIGAAVPLASPLALEAPEELRAPSFNARRELGVVNLGGGGSVLVDGQRWDLGRRDGLYVGRGAREVVFASDREEEPSLFYLVSHPAHAALPTQGVPQAEAQTVAIGEAKNASARVLRRYIHASGAASCQLVMGVTELLSGSVWNTMPPHIHRRRTEIYLYFDLPPEGAVFHFMGTPRSTRHLVVRNLQAVLSPCWSVHFGAGSAPYAFVWSMGGENQEFEDMQGLALDQLC